MSLTSCRRGATPPIPCQDYVHADLEDPEATKAALAGAGDCTDLFFGAFQYNADPYKEAAINVAILENTISALRAAGAPLRRVMIAEGSKAYGALLGPMRTPAKETDPRVPGPLYYFDQEDFLFERGARDGFVSKILRPDFIVGIGFGSYVNTANTLAVYATVCKAMGLPLYFPGTPTAYNTLFQLTDARLLARGMIWAAETGEDKDEIYNITNGDLFRWANVWPRIARYFELEPGHPLIIDLDLFMRDKASLWADLTRKHGLVVPFKDMVNWDWASFRLAYEIHTSTIKIRKAGFHECLDSDDRFFELFDEMRARKFIP
jgi:nucleoside-diphosphate-sugar epimerase